MAAGFVVVVRFDAVEALIRPVKPYLPSGELVVTHGASPITIVMQLTFAMGVAVALPVILYQVWALLSPALHAHERRLVMVVVAVSTLLFALGDEFGRISSSSSATRPCVLRRSVVR